MVEAFGDELMLASALREVAPPVMRTRRLRIWRGLSIPEGEAADEASFGLAWTCNRDIACWFAFRFCFDERRAFVFETVVSPDQIITTWSGR
jgi:hypothetical protein